MVVGRDAPLLVLREWQRLIGGNVLPGFSCEVGKIFEGIAQDLRE